MFTKVRGAAKVTMINTQFYYLAQVNNQYGSDAYGGGSYQCNEGDASCQTVQAPSTGFLSSGPEILVPSILGASVIIAVIVVLIKKRLQKPKK